MNAELCLCNDCKKAMGNVDTVALQEKRDDDAQS